MELGLFGSILGHIGDGNFHETILFEEKQRKEVEDCVDKMVARALEMEGTCTVSITHPFLPQRLLTLFSAGRARYWPGKEGLSPGGGRRCAHRRNEGHQGQLRPALVDESG